MRMRLLAIAACAAAAPACGALLGTDEDETPAPVDSAAPAVDAALEAEDAQGEANPDAAIDASGEATTDAATDATKDVVTDAPLVADKIVFVTQYLYSGSFPNGIAGADVECATAASLSNNSALMGHKGTYKAYLAQLDGSAPWARFTVDHVWGRLDGTVVFGKSPAKEAPRTRILISETGATIPSDANKFVWTGVADFATPDQRTCTDWTSNASNVFGGYGDPTSATQWANVNGNTVACNTMYRLYCFED